MAQMEALRRELKTGKRGGVNTDFGDTGGAGGVRSQEAERLRRELNEAREKEVGAARGWCTWADRDGARCDGAAAGWP